MAPSKPVLRQQRMDVYNSTSTGHQVGSGVSKPAVYHKSRSAKLQQQFKQAPLTAFLTTAKVATLGLSAAKDKGAVTSLAASSTDQSSKRPVPSSSSEPKRKIFAGCSIYVNGSTAPRISDVELKRLLSHHGARISMTLARKTTTHVVISDMGGGGLAAGKLQKEITSKKNNIRYVSVQWALDSMAAGKRLPESRFSTLNLHSQNQKPLASMCSGAGKEK